MFDLRVITSVVLVDEEGRFLLGKRSMDEDVFPGLWSVPGGKVEHGDGTPVHDVLEKNVQKEIKEEVGVDVEVDDYIQSHSDGKNKIYIIFKGHITDGTPEPLDETEEVRWFSFDELEPEKLCPEVYDFLKKVR